MNNLLYVAAPTFQQAIPHLEAAGYTHHDLLGNGKDSFIRLVTLPKHIQGSQYGIRVYFVGNSADLRRETRQALDYMQAQGRITWDTETPLPDRAAFLTPPVKPLSTVDLNLAQLLSRRKREPYESEKTQK